MFLCFCEQYCLCKFYIFWIISIMTLILAFTNDYICTHTHTDTYPPAPLMMCFYWNSRARSWHMENLVWMSSWQSGNLIRYSPRVLSTQSNLLSTCFQAAGISHPPPTNLNPFSIHLAWYCLATFSVQLQEMLPSPWCQLFSQPTYILPLPLYNTLHLCNTFLSRFSKFFQIYYFISFLDNPIMNTGISNQKFVNSSDSRKSFGGW